MAEKQHDGAQTRGARKSGVVGVLLIASVAIAWLAGALAQPAAADHGGSHAVQGYFLADSGGHMTRFGEAMDTGSLLGSTLRAPIVDGDTTPSGNGSVLVASDGGVFAFGDAPFLGSMAGAPLAAPIVTIEMTATGRGYLMAAADGGVFAFGDARFRGSLGGLRLNQPIVDMALNAANDGYLLAAADGGVFAFGQSRFRGSMGGRPLNKPIVGILPGETTGYGLVASDGGIFAFGGFVFRGSLGSLTLQAPIVDAVVSSTGDGYNMVASDGGVFAFGDAPFVGSLARLPLPRPIVTILGLGNQPPKADDDAYTTTEDTVLTRNAASGVLANDTDRDGDTLTAAVATGPTKGTLVLNADGSFTYTPNANTNGADSFTYTVSDPHGKRDTATVSITVDAVNDPPVAANDTGATNEDTPLTVAAPGVLGNDTDVEGSPLTATVVTGPAKGTLTLNANGSFTYTPNTNANGSDSFTYRANDGTANSNVATVSLTVNAVNDAPVAVNDSRTTNEDTVLTVAAPGVLGNDTDVEGSPLTAALVSGPSQGTLTLNPNGSFTYTPNADYNGADSFTYRANDGTANSNTATVAITVSSVNDAPVAVNDAHATNEDTPLVVPAPGVLGNDTDVEGSALTATVVAGPTKGTLTLNSNGSFTYTPNANANGPDSFTYRANDGTANSNVATVSLTVNAVNDAPVAVNDAHATNEDTVLNVAPPGVLGNDSDVEGSPLTAALVSAPTKGAVTLNANGSFTYTPNANANGSDSFTYRANDGAANSNVATVTLTVTAVNDPPVAGDDTFATNEDTALNGNVLTNDSDLDGHALSISTSTSPSHGTLTLNATTGAFTYTPNANYNGADSFTYTVSDGNGGNDTASVSITVNAVNDAPAAVNDTYATDEDTVLNVTAPGVLANDSDVEGSPITAVLVAGPGKGTLTLNANGSFTYTPNANANGADSFTYKANDGAAQGNTATVSLTVNAVNDAPAAVNDSYSTSEDTPLTVAAPGVLANDSDAEGSGLTAAVVTGPTKGTVTLNSNGSFTYTPNANSNGPDSFTYRANDGTANSNTATVAITVNAVNDAPVAVNDSHTTNEDTPLTVVAPGVLANDSDTEGNALTAVLVTGPTKGTLTLNANGSFTYTPSANTNGADSFTYKANDGSADSSAATVSLTVNAVNDAPVAVNDAYATNEDTQLSVAAPAVLGNDTDVEGPTSAVLVSGPAHGTLTLNADGSFAYMPTANYNGADSFTYKVNDGAADSGVATVALTVNSVNDVPIAVNDSYSTGEDTPLTVSAPGVLVNDSDIESAVTAVLGTGPAHGTLTLNPNGSFTYTPAANYAGADSFTYRASDGTAQSNLATVSLTVTGVNDAPVAVNDSRTTNEDTVLTVAAPGVLGNDTDADGNSLTAVLVAGPAKGTLTLNANGSFTYTPNLNTNGADSFTYKANDGTADSNTATVSLTVNPVNDAPVAVDDAYATSEDTPLVVSAPGVLANDTDVEGSKSATNFGSAVNGTVTGNADGSFTFTPNANFSGTASFGYTVSDGTLTDTGAVTITVSPVNDAPAAGNNNFLTNEDTPFTVTAPGVLANDTDVEGNSLTAVKLSDPTLGVLAFNSNGSFTYTPNANATGVDSFTYKANDGSADSNTATVFITVDAVNDPPAAVDDSYQTLQVTPLIVTAPGVLGNDTDADGPALTAGNASDPANGTVTLNANGSFTYTPDAGFTGTDTFTYNVSDGTATDAGLVTISVTPPNATPTADATSASGNEDGGAITVTLTGHDADGDALTFTANTATNGLVTVPSGTSCDANTPSTCTATVTYTPNPNFNGGDSFTYKVNDGTIDSAAATATMTITAVNDEPSFTKGSNQAVNEDAGARTVNGWATAISAGPANESGQTVTFTVTTNNNGLFSSVPAVSSTGNLTYTPAVNANGSATVSVTPADNGGTANGGDDTGATQTFTITVTAVNDVPSFTKGSDQTVNEDAVAQSISNWATAISKGPADESAQSLSFTTLNDNNALFSVQPGVTDTGTLAYTPAPNAVGSATITISLSDTGGTANGGDDTSDSQTFTITVDPVNDAPRFTKGANQTVNEDTGAQTVTGWATAISNGPADESAQATTFQTVGTSNNALFSVLPAVAPNGDLTYTPAANAFGSATVTVRAKDDGGVANGGVDTSGNQTFDITVNSVNDVPVAVDDAASTDEDTSKVVDVLANDTDVDTADTLTVDSVTQPTSGSVTIPLDKSDVTFSPGADFHDLDTGETEQVTFTYTVSDGNGGTDTATVTITVTGVNDAPSATDQSHTGFGNTSLAVGGASVTGPKTTASGGALTGLTDPDDTSHTATTSGTSANGGTVGMNANGTFSYLPAPGYEGSDTFDFTVSDGEATDTETVTVTVAGMAWYVDNSLAPAGDGRSSSPYNSLVPLNNDGADLDAANETIFVYQGSGAYGALNLESGQKLHGHPYGLVTGSHTLVAENTAGTRPTIAAVSLGANSDLQAVVLGGNAGAPSLSGTNVGTATVGTDPDHNVTLTNPSGGGMTLNGGTPTIELTSLTSGGGTNGISLTNLGGSVTIPAGAVTGASGSDVFVSGGNASTISYGGTVTNTAGRSVEILNRTAGTVTLSGAITDTAQGIALTNNDNSTVRFTSGSVSSTVTGANNAFAATQGGTVELTGANNTLSAAGGHALQVEDTTISNNGLVLKSVAATGGTHGIKLSSTGSGPLTVTGSGTVNSGGIITGTTSHGVSLNATTGISLTRMRIAASGDDGISGTNVTGFTFANGTVQANGNAVGDGGMDFANLLGTSNITSSTITASHDHNLDVVNDTGTATIGIAGSTVTSSVINSGVNVETTSTGGGRAVATVNVTGTTTISDNFADGIQCSGTALSGAAGSELTCNVTGATFNSNNIAMDITQSQNADVVFNVQSNTITNHDSHGVNLFTNSPLVSGASMTGKFMNNVIGTAGAKDSGSAIGSGLRAVVQGRADTAIRIEGNTIREVPNGYGLDIYGRTGDGGADFTVVNNTVVKPTGTNRSICDGIVGNMCPLDAFHIEANSGNVVCAKVSGNVGYDPNSVAPYGSGFAYYLRRGATAAPAGGTTATTFRLEGTSGTGATEIAATNTGSPVQVDSTVTVVAPGTCTTVP